MNDLPVLRCSADTHLNKVRRFLLYMLLYAGLPRFIPVTFIVRHFPDTVVHFLTHGWHISLEVQAAAVLFIWLWLLCLRGPVQFIGQCNGIEEPCKEYLCAKETPAYVQPAGIRIHRRCVKLRVLPGAEENWVQSESQDWHQCGMAPFSQMSYLGTV